MTTLAFALILASALLHAVWNFAARKARGDLSVLLMGLWVSVIVCGSVVLATRDVATILSAYPYVLVTGIVHAAYFVALARCYERGDISVVYPVARGTGVMGAAAMGIVFLGETPGAAGMVGVATICVGVVLVGLAKGRDRPKTEGLATALLVGGIIACYTVVDKIGVGRTDPLIYIFNMYVISAVLSTLYGFVHSGGLSARTVRERWPQSLVVGLGSTGAYLIVLFALRIAPVSYTAAVREVAVVFGALLGFLFLSEPARPWRLVGITAIVAGLLVIRLA